MSVELIDLFAGSAGTALVGHTPDTGTAWSGSAGFLYPPSDLALTGDGSVYNRAPSSGFSSLILSPTTYAGSIHEVRATFAFLTNLGAGFNCGLPLYTPANAGADCRFKWENGQWLLSLPGTGGVVAAFAYPGNGTLVEVRVTCVDGATRTVTCEFSTDLGVTWTTLFGGAKTYTADANPFAPGVWYDGLNTPTTGVLVRNLRVGSPNANPLLSVSPTTFNAGTPGTLTLAGTGTDWVAGTPGTPTFSVSGGTSPGVSGQVIQTVRGSTLTLNPGSAAGTLTITDPTGGTASVTVNASGNPTSVTLANTPTTCTVGQESAQIVVTLDAAAPSGGTVVNFASTGSGDVFHATPGGGTVTSVTIAQGQTTGHVFLVAGTAGSRNVSITSSGLTVAGSPLSITASASIPGLTVSPSTATAIDGGSPVAITATRVNSSAALAASLSGAGSISTSSPTSGVAFNYTPPSSGTGTATVTVTDATDSLSGTCVISYAPASVNVQYLTGVRNFPAGLVGGTTAGFGYRVSLDGGAFGSLQTGGISEDAPGSYSAYPVAASASLLKVKWSDGSGNSLVDLNVQAIAPNSVLTLPNSSVVLDGGTVSNYPQPPTKTTFYGDPSTLTAPTGTYDLMAVRTTTPGKPILRRGITSYTFAAGAPYFVLAGALPSPLAAGDTFVIE